MLGCSVSVVGVEGGSTERLHDEAELCNGGGGVEGLHGDAKSVTETGGGFPVVK